MLLRENAAGISAMVNRTSTWISSALSLGPSIKFQSEASYQAVLRWLVLSSPKWTSVPLIGRMRNAPQVIRKTMFLSKSYLSIALLWSKIYYHAPSAQASSSHHKKKSKRMQRLNSWQCQKIGPTQSTSIVFTRPLTMWRRRRSMTVI